MLTVYDKQQMALDKQRAAKRDRERVAELEAALFECARISGADVSEGVPTWPAVEVWAVQEVQALRDAYDEELNEVMP